MRRGIRVTPGLLLIFAAMARIENARRSEVQSVLGKPLSGKE